MTLGLPLIFAGDATGLTAFLHAESPPGSLGDVPYEVNCNDVQHVKRMFAPQSLPNRPQVCDLNSESLHLLLVAALSETSSGMEVIQGCKLASCHTHTHTPTS